MRFGVHEFPKGWDSIASYSASIFRESCHRDQQVALFLDFTAKFPWPGYICICPQRCGCRSACMCALMYVSLRIPLLICLSVGRWFGPSVRLSVCLPACLPISSICRTDPTWSSEFDHSSNRKRLCSLFIIGACIGRSSHLPVAGATSSKDPTVKLSAVCFCFSRPDPV